jgi:hypothetical protein
MSDQDARPEDNTDHEPYIFVITQIGEKGSPERKRTDEIHEFVIAPTAEAYSLAVKRSDLDATPGVITTQIIKGIIGARVVVADLTGNNPNVFFELGVAQSFAKPLILIVNTAQHLPFDLKTTRTIVVDDGEVLGAAVARAASEALSQSLVIVLASDYVPTNVVTEVATARTLDRLTPESPLFALTAFTEEVLTRVRRIERITARPTGADRDFGIMRRFLELLVTEGRIEPLELTNLIGERTSNSFDRWTAKQEDIIQSRLESLQEKPRPSSYEFDEEPF